MRSHSSFRFAALISSVLILLAAGGCLPSLYDNTTITFYRSLLNANNVISFATGWLARGWIDGNPVTTCYQNGQPIDCGSLPAELMQ